MKKSKKILGPLILITAAMIWGLSFVAQKEGTKYIGGFTFNGIRNVIGTLVLLPFVVANNKKIKISLSDGAKRVKQRNDLKGVLLVGLALFAGSNLQQFAFNYIDPGKVGFITALYMLLVPIIRLFMKEKSPFTVWIGVVLGVGGLYMICGGGGSGLHFGHGEMLTFLCAIAFALHIILIDKYAKEIDAVTLSCGQFFVTAVLTCICMFIFEEPHLNQLIQAGIPILYAGIMSCGVAFTFQIIGQKYTDPTIASMLLCLESVFSVIFSFLILHTQMSVTEYIGCAVMFIAIIIAQIPVKKKSLK